jgi:hypothetical protein
MPPADPDRRSVLVVDYPGRRNAARVADLRPDTIGLDARYPLETVFPRELTAAAYAAGLLDSTDTRRSPVAVFGYCMAGPIAHEAAALLGDGSEPVPLVLFDACPATPAAVGRQFEVAVAQLVEQLGGSDVDIGVGLDPDLVEHSPERAVAAMRDELVRLGTAAAGGDEDEAADLATDLAQFYLDWLVHLIAAYHCSWPALGGPVLHVMSAGHTYTDDWPGAASTDRLRVDVARADLLRTDEVRQAVRDWLPHPSTAHVTPTAEET